MDVSLDDSPKQTKVGGGIVSTFSVVRGSRRKCAACGLRRVVYAIHIESLGASVTGPLRCKDCSGL